MNQFHPLDHQNYYADMYYPSSSSGHEEDNYRNYFSEETTNSSETKYWDLDHGQNPIEKDNNFRQQQQPQQQQQPIVKVVKKRCTANRKERRRTLSIAKAFADLRDVIPNVPVDTKLSKIKTLRLATSYICYLMGVLNSDDPTAFTKQGFKVDLGSNDYRKSNKISSSSYEIQKRNKGRTGWPQHVWALELHTA